MVVYGKIVAQSDDIHVLQMKVFELKLQTQSACCLVGVYVAIKKCLGICVVASCNIIDIRQRSATAQHT